MTLDRPKPVQVMPDEATKVFSGILFDVYQWDQQLFDGTKTRFEKLKRREDTAMVIGLTNDNKFVFLEEEQPGKAIFFGPAGGRIGFDEDPMTGAERELFEETGYKAESYDLWFTTQPSGKIDWAVYVFIARGLKKIGEPQPDADERIVVRELTFQEFIDGCIDGKISDVYLRVKVLEEIAKPGGLIGLQKFFTS